MCEPTTLMAVGLALSAATAAVSYYQADKNADTQKEAVEKSARLQQEDLTRQAEQQREAAAAQMNEHARKAFKDVALFDVVTGEFGGGNTTDRTASIGNVQNSEQLSTLATNSSNALQENSFQSSAVRSQALARINTIQRPSLLGTGLQLASASVNYQSGVNKYNADQAKLTKPVK